MQTVDKIKNMVVSVEAPPSKAHTLRALVIGALAEGQTTIEKPLLGRDQLNVVGCLRGLGTEIELLDERIIVRGCGGQFRPRVDELNVGESGVGMNFLTSAACLCDRPVTITGSARITERPIAEIVNGLRALGCKIEYLKNEGYPPVRIFPEGIKGGAARMSGAKSSQYFSSLIVSAPYAKAPVTIECVDELTEKPYVDITIQMAMKFGARLENQNYKRFIIPQGKYRGQTIRIEGDYSSASFFFLAGAICSASVSVGNLRRDTKQGDRAFLDLMKQMGCKVERGNNYVTVRGGLLSPIERDMSDVPDLVPPTAIACAFAQGTSRLTNIAHLRHKECDRLAVMAWQLQKMGVQARCDESSLTIEGNPDAHGAVIDPHNDHRIAMSFAAAGLATGGQKIENPGCVAKSFPDFWERFEVFRK